MSAKAKPTHKKKSPAEVRFLLSPKLSACPVKPSNITTHRLVSICPLKRLLPMPTRCLYTTAVMHTLQSFSLHPSHSILPLTPLQFFAENQNIAGFDNPGKALYTTIRELVENGLDAAETISVLPEIDVSVEEMTADMFNERCGMAHVSRVDEELYQAATPAGKKVRRQRGLL